MRPGEFSENLAKSNTELREYLKRVEMVRTITTSPKKRPHLSVFLCF